MRLEAKTAEKLADRFCPNPSLEAKDKEGRDHQTDEPTATFGCFPQPGLGVAVSAVHRLEMTMHTAFAKAGAFGKASNTLLAMFTNRVENPKTFSPQSHVVGPGSEGWLKSQHYSALQIT
jgi:hypothetical protein